MSTRILVLVGSLRAASYNHKLAEAAVALAPEGIAVEIYQGLADLPFYNEDLDQPPAVPATADALRAAVRSADALLMITPEYNGTAPPALNNAIDWASRPDHNAVIDQKPIAVIGTSGGRGGGASAHDDVRRAARLAGGTVLDDIKLSVPRAGTRFAAIHPACDDEITATMPTILAALAAATRKTRFQEVHVKSTFGFGGGDYYRASSHRA